MTPHPAPRLRLLSCVLISALRLLVLAVLVSALPMRAADPGKKTFDIAAGEAVVALRQFAEQSGVELLYSTRELEGVSTKGVRGELAPRVALDRMLSGTPLTVTQGRSSGALAITRAVDPNAGRAVPAPTSDRPRQNNAPGAGKMAAAAETPGRAEDRPIQMSPFQVSTENDTGYVAADVISAGLLRTNLLKTPADITVLTRDFIDDIGATNIMEASLYLTSSDVVFPQERDFASNVSFRGVPSNGTRRNLFTQAYTPEEYISERLEGARGPNALLYGDAFLGGVSNVMSKRASTARNTNTARFRFDTNRSRALMIDANRVLTPNLAVRAVLNESQGRTWIKNYYDNRHGGFLALTYRPWRGAEVRVEGELDYLDRTNRADFFTDQASSWDGRTGISAPITSAASLAGTGIGQRTTDFWVSIPALGPDLINLRNFGVSTGSNLAVINDGSRAAIARFPVLSRKAYASEIQPRQMHTAAHNQNASIFLEQAFDSGFVLEAAMDYSAQLRKGNTNFYQQLFVDVNERLPDGRANPYFGKYYTLSNGGINPIVHSADYYTSSRLMGAYPIKTEKFSVVLNPGIQYREHLFRVPSWNYYQTNGTVPFFNPATGALNTLAQNMVNHVIYLDEPVRDVRLPRDPNTRYVQTRDLSNYEKLASAQFGAVGQFFQETLTLVGGYRYDRFEANVRNQGARQPFDYDRWAYTYVSGKPKTHTKMLGATYFPLKWIGVQANWNEGFRALIGTAPTITGGANPNLARNEGFSTGLRFNLAGGRLTSSVTYYQTTEVERPVTFGITGINAIWTAMQRPDRQLLGGLFGSIVDKQDTVGRGWEADAVFNPIKGLRIGANLALPRTTQRNSVPDIQAYVDTHFATWQAATNDASLSQADRTVIANQIANVRNAISGFAEGRSPNGLYVYRYNVFGNYTVQSGALKDVRFGAGANLFSKKIIGNPTGRVYDYIYADAWYLVSASVGYSLRWNRTRVDLQLNVNNLFDHRDPIYTTVAQVGAMAYRNGYTYTEPRNARLTATFKF